MLSPKEIKELYKSLSTQKDWSFGESLPSETGKWTHSYHRYPAKFIPQLVEKLFDRYCDKKDMHINDPFMGSGTTVVSAISRGFFASGTDINGIAYLVTKVKSRPIDPIYLEAETDKLLSKIRVALNEESVEPLIPKINRERIDYWFTTDKVIELGIINQIISEYTDQTLREYFTVAFSHILKSCSIWLQSSTKPTRDFSKKSSNTFFTLKKHLNKMKKGNLEFYKVVPKDTRENLDKYLNISLSDARCQPVKDESVDLIVSSSPYVTSYEYADVHQLSTIWLNFAEDLKKYRGKFIGTAYKEMSKSRNFSKIAEEITYNMSSKDTRMAVEIGQFFFDMQEVFNESYRILKPGGRCCFVIGNTKLVGVEILNAEVFTESLQIAGMKIDDIVKREIPSKILPQNRDSKTGKFASVSNADSQAYPVEYVVVGQKDG